MCRNIKTLYNFEPPTTDEEIRAAAMQFVRKVTGFREPSRVNRAAFDQAIADISSTTKRLLGDLMTDAQPHNREVEAAKAHERALKRFAQYS
jgi:hypothetical protein